MDILSLGLGFSINSNDIPELNGEEINHPICEDGVWTEEDCFYWCDGELYPNLDPFWNNSSEVVSLTSELEEAIQKWNASISEWKLVKVYSEEYDDCRETFTRTSEKHWEHPVYGELHTALIPTIFKQARVKPCEITPEIISTYLHEKGKHTNIKNRQKEAVKEWFNYWFK